MIILGFILIVIAALLLVIGLFTTNNGNLHDQTATLLGIPVGSTAIFVVGFVAGVVLLFGLTVVKWGGKHEYKEFKERRQTKKLAKGLAAAQKEGKDA